MVMRTITGVGMGMGMDMDIDIGTSIGRVLGMASSLPPLAQSLLSAQSHLLAQSRLSAQFLLSTLACHLKKRIVAGGRNRWTASVFVKFFIICLPMQASS